MKKKITTDQNNQNGRDKFDGGYKPRGSQRQPREKPPTQQPPKQQPPKQQPSGGEKETKK